MAQLAQRVKPADPGAPSLTLGRSAAQFRSDQPYKDGLLLRFIMLLHYLWLYLKIMFV